MLMEIVMPHIMIVLGLVLAFWGARMVEMVARIVGAIIGAFVGFYIYIGFLVHMVDWFSESDQNFTIGLFVVVLIFALLGAYLAFSYLRSIVSFTMAAAVYFICWNFLGQPPSPLESGDLDMGWLACLILAVVTYLLVHHYFRELLSYTTAVLGAFIMGNGLTSVLVYYDMIGGAFNIAVIVAMVLVAGLGAKYQLSGKLTDVGDQKRKPAPRRGSRGRRR